MHTLKHARAALVSHYNSRRSISYLGSGDSSGKSEPIVRNKWQINANGFDDYGRKCKCVSTLVRACVRANEAAPSAQL